MQEENCLNCGVKLSPGQKFCYNCGQKLNLGRITLTHLFVDFFRIISHAERGLLNLAKGLAIDPGGVAIEYVEGKRKKYFNPFTFLAVCITVMVLLNSLIKPYAGLPVPDPNVASFMPDQHTRELYELTVKRIANMQRVGNHNVNLFTVLVSPYFAYFLWLFFKRRGRNVAEIMVAYILYTGFANVISTIIFSPFLAMVRHTGAYYPLFALSLFAQTMYYSWGLKKFLGFNTTGGYFKVLGALTLIGVIGFILLIVVLFFYVYHGAFSVFPYLNG
ncbi:MAG TPA: DUF3667 domain-containing protein [Chitinophagaceae bacterium]|nr:DUF3667 domain-containing protein [Chitinophagaceae bacterium]